MNLLVQNLHYGYSVGTDVLAGISLSYDSPQPLCILGANGAGKSTLLRCIVGELRRHSGSVLLDGCPISAFNARQLARKLAYIPQSHTATFSFPVIDVVTMGRTSWMRYFSSPSAEDKAAAAEALEYLGISHLGLRPYTEISGGERQLVMIAAALTQQPELILFDEPTSHLDFGNQHRFLILVRRLAEKGIGVLMTTHFPDHALALNGRTVLLRDGHIHATGLAKEVITADNMRVLYNIDITVGQIGERSICVAQHEDFA